MLIPGVGGVLAEELHYTIEDFAVRHRLLAVLAIERNERNAPDALARDAPVRPRGDHVRHALLAPRGYPLDVLNCFQRPLAQIVAFHADEPLFGGAKNCRVVAAPAMRIAVRDLFLAEQRSVRFQNLANDRVRLPDRLADDLFRKPARRAFRVIEASGGINRAVDRKAVLNPDLEVFLAVSRRGVDSAGTLLQRYVIRQNPERIAIEKRMAEDGAFELPPRKSGE